MLLIARARKIVRRVLRYAAGEGRTGGGHPAESPTAIDKWMLRSDLRDAAFLEPKAGRYGRIRFTEKDG
jgi:hypothetical protein